MFFEKLLSIATFLLVFNIHKPAALLMHGNSNSTNMISAGQHFNLTEIVQILQNQTTELRNLKQQTESDRSTIQLLKNQTTELQNLKQQVESARSTIQLLQNQTTELQNIKQQTESDGSTIQLLQNRVFFLEAELKNLNTSNENTTKRLNEAVSNLENLKVQMRYTGRSLLDVSSKTEQLNTTLLKVFNDGMLDVHSKTEQLNTTLLKVFNDGMLDVHSKTEQLNTTLLKVFNDGMLGVHSKTEQLNTTLLKVFNDGMLDVHSKTEQLNTTLLKVFNDGMLDVHSKTVQLNTTLLKVFNVGMSGVREQIANINRKVTFTAGVSSASSSWSSGTLVFPRVVYNIGGGYDPNSGVFTSPVDGHFVFFLNVQSYSTCIIYTSLVLNGTPKVSTMAFTPQYSSGPNLAVLRLQKGDRVWVKHHTGKGYVTYTDAPVTTFSGFLI